MVYCTWVDRVCEVIKYICFIALTVSVHYMVQIKHLQTVTSINDIEFTWRDLGLTLLVFVLIRVIFDKVLLALFDMESLSLYDRFMLEDCEGNWVNMTGASRFGKQDFTTLKEKLFQRLKHVPRCQSKMVKFLGTWYFKKMSEDEFAKVKDVVI